MKISDEKARAKWAWEQVDAAIKGLSAEKTGRYGTLTRKLPSYLHTSGLGQTLAFLCAKGKGEGADGREASSGEGMLTRQLRGALFELMEVDRRSTVQLMQKVVELSAEEYEAASFELMARALWLKRMAEGRNIGKLTDDDPEEG